MGPVSIVIVLSGYFILLFVISYFTGKKSDNNSFFLGNKKSPWYVVAFGMIGSSLSGVTFISAPGWVGATQFSYLQMVLGYLLGYFVIANVLLPVYYKLNLTSIYTYLLQRFGQTSYKTGASFFLLSRTIGTAFRLFLMANVLQYTVFDAWGIPFWVTVFVTILLIWLYTFKGGIGTIIWTDTLQTLFMLSAVGLCVYFIAGAMDMSLTSAIKQVIKSEYSKTWFFTDIKAPTHFVKQFLSGAFITIVMTGLDQDMMQKNLSCRSLPDAKKNMYWYGAAFLPANILFLTLGALLYMYANNNGIALPDKADNLFPMIATRGYLPPVVAVLFMLGIVAAAYSTADSALTALTTSFTIDILEIERKNFTQKKQIQVRKIMHILVSIFVGIVIVLFNIVHNDSVISSIFKVAGYTYGPLLGMYAFGLFTKYNIHDKYVWIIALISPIICIFIDIYSELLFFGYKFGYELLILNGLLTFTGLLLIRKKK